MKRISYYLALFISFNGFAAQSPPYCSGWFSFLNAKCLQQIWNQGTNDVYLSGYAWHNRYTYSPEKINQYNEAAWGGGFGKGFFDENGDWHTISAIAFLDSHKNIEPLVGYAYVKTAKFTESFRAGLGYTLFLTARADINRGAPFPGALPWASVFYKRVALSATYIPGAAGAGNVLYILGKVSF